MNAPENNQLANPTDKIALDFRAYVQRKRIEATRFTSNGRPDYAFRGDFRLRETFGAIGPLRRAAEALTATAASVHRQRALMTMAQATSTQFPILCGLIRECAERLHLPMPSLFVESSPIVNAYTIATDDRAPIVVISSACADAMTEDELRFVLGHECGHIHNMHGVHSFMVILAGNTALPCLASLFSITGRVVSIAQLGMRFGLAAWSRAAEITCDRAGALCVIDVQSPASALGKLSAPLMSGKFGAVDPDQLVRQAQSVSRSMLRLEESWHSHPIVGQRIIAVNRFMTSDVFCARRPDLAIHSNRLPLAIIDDELERLLGGPEFI